MHNPRPAVVCARPSSLRIRTTPEYGGGAEAF